MPIGHSFPRKAGRRYRLESAPFGYAWVQKALLLQGFFFFAAIPAFAASQERGGRTDGVMPEAQNASPSRIRHGRGGLAGVQPWRGGNIHKSLLYYRQTRNGFARRAVCIIMKPFERKNQLLSLCGLNCGLCPMRLGGHRGGCGNGNRACAVARCSLEQERPIEYCYECRRYPCERYRHIDEFDSFITHRRQKADAEKAQRLGIEAYNREQTEKLGMLTKLLAEYNGGREKTLFCTAVNLLPLDDLREILQTLAESTALAALPEKSAHAAALLRQAAAARDIELRLRRKK